MARTKKELLPVDAWIASLLADHVESAGITRRDLAQTTGMSANRIGIILRQTPPPATVGEIGLIARAVGLTASAVIAEAERLASTADPHVVAVAAHLRRHIRDAGYSVEAFHKAVKQVGSPIGRETLEAHLAGDSEMTMETLFTYLAALGLDDADEFLDAAHRPPRRDAV